MQQPSLRTILEAEGVVILAEHDLGYWDGGEDRVRSILANATDRSSTSHELTIAGSNWPERYHLSKERSNIIRPLNLAPDARVLEIGAGCGAVTRYLGEQCGSVDALEPVPGRARAARARTQDLENVTVFVGLLDDLPDEPVYDAVFVIGVLEYVGNGTKDLAPYEEFLRAIERRLKPGGHLVLAIENRLGVKYLAGAPEDHTGHPFDSLEDYPNGTPARTFAQAELAALCTSVGLDPRTLVAFPDYKMTRAVIAPDVPGIPIPLLRNVPNLPSPEWSGERAWTVDEGCLWSTLVDAGLASEFPNSLLVLGTKPGNVGEGLWATNRAATYFTTGRATPLSARIDVDVDAGHAVRFTRRPLVEGLEPIANDVRVHFRNSIYIEGTHLVDLLAAPDADDGMVKARLQEWIQLLDTVTAASPTEAGHHWDAIPHNVIVDANEQLHLIDDEWEVAGASRDDIIARGVLLTGLALAERTPPARWPACTTTGDVVTHLGVLGNLPADWLTPTIACEAEFQTTVHGAAQTAAERASEIEFRVREFEERLAVPLSFQRLSSLRAWSPERHRQARAELEANIDALTAERNRLLEIETDLHQRLEATTTELDAIRSTWSWRLTGPLRKLRP